ncbi:hypothetical protein [Dictyobacter arantiisoli]|uniref:Uncharacterized protein n=1 Tax=Dictyobacter arantiisoli TaxID=2014874 RepID=A0A5A5TL30_9CHLR|nr:hypothetical protein [Dictyobacter arantiisoli]GCF11809.1 hypothetical protein KDI_53730 [Dictyobacter arantiisoli]
MSNLPMDTFNREVVTIDRELKKLETQDGPVTGYDLIAKWNITYAKISHVLNKLHAFALEMDMYGKVAPMLYELQQRVERLPYVPDIRDVTRAQNVLALSPSIVVTEDVQPDKQEPELKRVTVVQNDGAILFDQDFLPTGIQKGALPAWDAPTSPTTPSLPLPQIWDDLTKAISGKYILAYDFVLIQMQLEVTALRFQLPIPVLIGESILDLYFAYHGTNVLPTIDEPGGAFPIPTAFYNQLGAPFSRDASYTPVERAARILHILQGIANCTLTTPSQPNE